MRIILKIIITPLSSILQYSHLVEHNFRIDLSSFNIEIQAPKLFIRLKSTEDMVASSPKPTEMDSNTARYTLKYYLINLNVFYSKVYI